MRVRTKLFAGVGGVAFSLLLVGALGAYEVGSIAARDAEVYESNVVPLELIGRMESVLGHLRVGLRDEVLAEDDAGREKAREQRRTEKRELEELLTKYETSVSDPRDRDAFKRVRTGFEDWSRVVDATMAEPGTPAELLPKLRPVGEEFSEALEGLSSVNVTLTQEAFEKSESDARFASVLLGAVALLVSVAAGAAGVGLSSQITARLSAANEVLRATAQGDLRKRLELNSGDEFEDMGKELNSALSSIQSTIVAFQAQIVSLGRASESLTSVSMGMSASATQTAQQAGAVASATEEVSMTMSGLAAGVEEMSATVSDISRNADQAAKVATSAVQVARATHETVSQLAESSAQIEQVLKVITAIAEQTNLLALNATIEAARAGDAAKVLRWWRAR